MQRKTNLFYLSGDDSNFLTFSNYTESLTGNYLSTNTKIFPSKFLCIYLDYLDVAGINKDDDAKHDTYNSRKSELIQFLAAYYENKLAYLRDHCVNKDMLVEKELLPLNYLLDALNLFCSTRYEYASEEETEAPSDDPFSTTTTTTIFDDVTDVSSTTTTTVGPIHIDASYEIRYVGEISEQDFNGTYSDTICIIDTSLYKKASVVSDTTKEIQRVKYENTGHLYGWTDAENEYQGPSEFREVEPIVDHTEYSEDEQETINYYNINSQITMLRLDECADSVVFNLLIPLYDTVNIDANVNTNIINSDNEIANLAAISLSNDDNLYISNVPYGIWFSGYKCVELNRDANYKYYPSWSLVLSSQFKPFPYSNYMHMEVDKTDKSLAFQTYSQILIRQNNLIDSLLTFQTQLNDIKERIINIEARLNTSSSYALDDMHTDIINYKNAINEEMAELKQYVNDIANNQYVWKAQLN